MPKIKLLSYTPDAELQVATAAKRCYSSLPIEEIQQFLRENPSKIRDLILFVWKRQHLSVFEHASFSFSVSGVSRVLSHQLVRHRVASYAQESQRYVNYTPADFPAPVVPPSIQASPWHEKFLEHYLAGIKLYHDMREAGVPKEDARYGLSESTSTQLVVTKNARQLFHFFELRCCKKAQWELREVADLMVKAAREVCPVLFEEAGPVCQRQSGRSCRENDPSCLNYPFPVRSEVK